MTEPGGPVAEPPPVSEPPEPATEPQAEAGLADDEIEAVPVEAEPAPYRPRRPAAGARRPSRGEGRSSALVWAGAAALAAALIAGAIVFREQIVRLFPKSSSAYAGLGLAVDGGGLVIEQVHVQPAFLAGRPVLSVSGAIRNVRDVEVDAPPVRFTLLNHAGQPVAAKIARPLEAAIPARAERHFVVTMLDPPASARDLEVRFETAGGRTGAPRAAEAVPAPVSPPSPAPASAPSPAALAPAEAIAPSSPAAGGPERG